MYYVKLINTLAINQYQVSNSDTVFYEKEFHTKKEAAYFFVEVVHPGGFTSTPSEYALVLFSDKDSLQTYFTSSLTKHITQSFRMEAISPHFTGVITSLS